MDRILVSGLINLETTLQVDGFPIDYTPVRFPFFGINSTISGVGFNIAKALTTLGDHVHLLSLIGKDQPGKLTRLALNAAQIDGSCVLESLEQTAQSVILYDPSSRRIINTDLKDIQQQSYPEEQFAQALFGSTLAVLCNINFSRQFLAKARKAGVRIATDVHTIADLEDSYNRDFMQAAHILFMSDEALPCEPREWARRVQERYGCEIVVIGMGDKGALLSVRSDQFIEHIPAVLTRPIINSIGAGDALFSCFIHYYHKSSDPYEAIRKAVVFASYKIGETSAANGFLTEPALEELYANQ